MGTRPIRYKEESSEALGVKAAGTWKYGLEPPDNPDLVTLHGPCPKCGDQFDYEWPLTLLRDAMMTAREVEAAEVLRRPATEERIPVLCRCKVKHPGAGDEPGCGRSWTLTVMVP